MKTYQTHHLNGDVLVAGGGPSGVPAALAAARAGAKVILVQDRPVLGGNASSEVRMHIVGANSGRPNADLVLETRETGIIEEIRLENAFRNAQRSPSMFDLILFEKCKAEPNITLLLNTTVTGCTVEDGTITEAEAIRPLTEDKFKIRAKVFIDCTGDGGLGASAGAAFFRGRESKEQYGESLAQDVADKKSLGSTILFMGRKHDKPMPFIAPPWARKFTEEDLKLRTHATVGVDSGLEYGYWWLEWGGEFDTIKEGEFIRDELLAIVMGVWDHIKNGGDHDAKCWALDWFGSVPGKRESRRFIGQHVLTENDVMQSAVFEDAIAYGGWPVDTHPPGGVDAIDEPPCTQIPVPRLYDIPLRSCVARDVKNLMFAGRNISATHVAFASTRVMATCAAVGEGVGAAAAWAVKNNVQPIELAGRPEAIFAIRQQLVRNDVYLIDGHKNAPENLADSAKITASSEQGNGRATNVISKQNRAVEGERGVDATRQIKGVHRWMSEPAQGLPAWLALNWDAPQRVSEVEFVFDSGLHRHMTLTQSVEYYKMMQWGTGQQELPKRFDLEMLVNGKWQLLQHVELNWQRRWTQRLETPVTLNALRITVHETWGLDHARVVGVAVY